MPGGDSNEHVRHSRSNIQDDGHVLRYDGCGYGGGYSHFSTPSESLRIVINRASNLEPTKLNDANRVLNILKIMDKIKESIDTAEDNTGV